jgi:hypothetical protein
MLSTEFLFPLGMQTPAIRWVTISQLPRSPVKEVVSMWSGEPSFLRVRECTGWINRIQWVIPYRF